MEPTSDLAGPAPAGPPPGALGTTDPGSAGTDTETDRDLAALEALEAELASLEGELDRVEHTPPAASPAPTGPSTPPLPGADPPR